MTRYLADSSIWAWVQNGTRPDVDAKLADRLQRGEVATAPPIVLEVMHRARSAAEYEAIFETLLAPLDWLPLTEQASERAVDVQRQLAATTHGNHRRPAVDYLIAATAETTGNDIRPLVLRR